jgi:hypothetical protein
MFESTLGEATGTWTTCYSHVQILRSSAPSRSAYKDSGWSSLAGLQLHDSLSISNNGNFSCGSVILIFSAIQLNSIRVHLMTEGLLSRSGFFEGITYALMLGLADHRHTMLCSQNIYNVNLADSNVLVQKQNS